MAALNNYIKISHVKMFMSLRCGKLSSSCPTNRLNVPTTLQMMSRNRCIQYPLYSKNFTLADAGSINTI